MAKNSFNCGIVLIGRMSYYTFSTCTSNGDTAVTVTNSVYGIDVYSMNWRDNSVNDVLPKYLIGRKASSIDEFCKWERITLKIERGHYEDGETRRYTLS